ncbi:hypothetical protein BB561_002202 [Smittium simulii]|uniref:snRNA-activating protein complex subunit 3 n=1 Tax=Smittium simulii TaxID=133385 RepID=A0A2T9YRA8_9FUNG|nr:hypothetical protein BB561_002202 [Smittium simulii]
MTDSQHSDKIDIQLFGNKASQTINSRHISSQFNLTESWSSAKISQVAEQCSVTEDLKFSSVVFANTKLFTLLKENYEEISNFSPTDKNETETSAISTTNLLEKEETATTTTHINVANLSDTNEKLNDISGKSSIEKNDVVVDNHISNSSGNGAVSNIDNMTAFIDKNTNDASEGCTSKSFEFSNSLYNTNAPINSNLLLSDSNAQHKNQPMSGKEAIDSELKVKNGNEKHFINAAKVLELEKQIRKIAYMLKKPKLLSLLKENTIELPIKLRQQMNHCVRKVGLSDAEKLQFVQNNNVNSDEEYYVEVSVRFMSPKQPSTKQAEFQVLGSQPLTVLRDAFYCINDFLVSSKTPQAQIENDLNRKLSSSFFFIENTFYNDVRHEDAVDYSKNIIDYYGPKRNFYTTQMGETKFEELQVRLGYPYLFCHDGNCEHLMYFTDISYKKIEAWQIEKYPHQTFRERSSRHKCRMCLLYPASFVTTNDFHAGETPCYFCQHCYRAFHYDSNNKLILDHNVYPYATTLL